MKKFLKKEKIEGVNKIIEEYRAIKPPIVINAPILETVTERSDKFAEEEVEFIPQGPKVFQMSRHVNGTIKFTITDKPEHAKKFNTLDTKLRMR